VRLFGKRLELLAGVRLDGLHGLDGIALCPGEVTALDVRRASVSRRLGAHRRGFFLHLRDAFGLGKLRIAHALGGLKLGLSHAEVPALPDVPHIAQRLGLLDLALHVGLLQRLYSLHVAPLVLARLDGRGHEGLDRQRAAALEDLGLLLDDGTERISPRAGHEALIGQRVVDSPKLALSLSKS
jgi:hypothetical protein